MSGLGSAATSHNLIVLSRLADAKILLSCENASSAISDLEPPDELRTQFDTYVSARDQAVEDLKKGQDAAENQDSHGYGAAQSAITKGAPQRKKLAGSLGFKVCSRNAGAA